ncbi:F-box protein At2g26850-like [Phalaenopsis equestris]|uniref:F-box protein At2g26850-like n=1 Tax=Phalaenopsis equestris TaxID=78828 RepID=UPI0009E392D9|nr:F-box protein At2g26850-like [Phalaenopsis equestris]
MLLLFLLPFLPFLLLSITHMPKNPIFPSFIHQILLFTLLLCQEFISHSTENIKNRTISLLQSLKSLNLMPRNKEITFDANSFHAIAAADITVLDLPELPLDCILKKLSPFELCNMACVCRSLRERCRSDDLWERHMREKWSRVIGETARRKWKLQAAEGRAFNIRGEAVGVTWKVWMGRLVSWWALSWLKHKMECRRKRNCPPDYSLVSFYQALESGRFSFTAQVYNRENGHTGFLMSCYDAEVCYNPRTGNLFARYPPHGKRIPAIEEVPWERTRAPSVVTPPHELHISDCLSDLHPGDHFEIQWRRNKEFPYGWWFGVIGHLETCDRSDRHCYCGSNETIVLEFNHYPAGSRWRRKTINRKEHSEDGDENHGFYGGIRKIHSKEEISKWMQFWPAQVL